MARFAHPGLVPVARFGAEEDLFTAIRGEEFGAFFVAMPVQGFGLVRMNASRLAFPNVAASGNYCMAATARSREAAHKCVRRSRENVRQTEILNELRHISCICNSVRSHARRKTLFLTS